MLKCLILLPDCWPFHWPTVGPSSAVSLWHLSYPTPILTVSANDLQLLSFWATRQSQQFFLLSPPGAAPTQVFAFTVLFIWSGAGIYRRTLRQGSSCLSEGVSSHCTLSFLMFTYLHLFLWCCRSEDLEYIYNQLRTIKVRSMVGLLDKLQSSYFPAFQSMFRDVVAGEEHQVFS